MVNIGAINQDIAEKILQLGKESIFYGEVSHIDKSDNLFKVTVDLFNQTTQEMDEIIYNDRESFSTYAFECVIVTPSLGILGHKNQLISFMRVNEETRGLDILEGSISLLTHHLYDRINKLKYKSMRFKVSKAFQDIKVKNNKRIKDSIEYLNSHIQVKENWDITRNQKKFNKSFGVRYSQYHVGKNHFCTYINFGNTSKGFFNIGYFVDNEKYTCQYFGISRHKPDWVILSNVQKEYYSGAIRYGSSAIFSCAWVIPVLQKIHLNMIRILKAIIRTEGQIHMLKYKANTSVGATEENEAKLNVYYTSFMNDTGLCLYIENDDKFISFGNSDFNFMTKSVVKQNFDVIVMPHQGSTLKTKVHTNNLQSKLTSSQGGSKLGKLRKRSGFKIHRTDLHGSYFCKL